MPNAEDASIPDIGEVKAVEVTVEYCTRVLKGVPVIAESPVAMTIGNNVSSRPDTALLTKEERVVDIDIREGQLALPMKGDLQLDARETIAKLKTSGETLDTPNVRKVVHKPHRRR